MASDSAVGAGLTRAQGLLWLAGFALLGSGLANLVELRPAPPRLVYASRAADGSIECYVGETIEVALVSRLDTTFDAGRMVLTVPVLDNEGGAGATARVVIPSGARTILVDRKGAVAVLAAPLPRAVLQALLEAGVPTLNERVARSEAALVALRSLPRIREFLTSP